MMLTAMMEEKAMKLEGIQACVFDAYGTLFDVAAVARGADEALGEHARAIVELWRAKQLQYTWLRGLAGHHADFWQVTEDALGFALSSHGLDDAALREQLMACYLRIPAYPEVPDVLHRLRAAGMKLAILSNGTPTMLVAAVDHAGLSDCFDAVLSVEAVGVFKPHPSVYRLGEQALGHPAQAMCFVSSNGWDACSARAYGYRVMWCNRFGQPAERIPSEPDGMLSDLNGLSTVLGLA